MAHDVLIAGALFPDVPSVQFPDSQQVWHSFTDVSDTTAAAADVAQGKVFYDASGVLTQGTASGGGGDDHHPAAKDNGKTYFYIEIPNNVLRHVPLTLSHRESGSTTIDWGDGSTPTSVTSSTTTTYTHDYAEQGRYVITVDVTGGYTTFGGGTASTTAFGTGSVSSTPSYTSMLVYAAEFGRNGADGSTISARSFQYCYGLRKVIVGRGVPALGQYAFANCLMLDTVEFISPSSLQSVDSSFMTTSMRALAYPSSLTSVTNPFSNMYSLVEASLPDGAAVSASGRILSVCILVERLVVPSAVTSVGSYAFSVPSSLRELHFQTTTPPTLTSTSFTGFPSECVIYVPRGSLNAYKTAQYWSALALQIQEEPE